MTETESAARQELITAARSVAARGLSHGTTGNLSRRWGDLFLVTPTQSSLESVKADQLALVDLDGQPVAGGAPSKEAYLHAAIYGSRPQAQAVVHTHSLHAAAVSCLAGLDPADALPPLTAYYAMRVQALPMVEYCAPGDRLLAELAGDTAKEHASMLLRNHGPVVAADTLGGGVQTIEEIEQTAKLFLLLNGQEMSPIDQEERARLFERTNNQSRK